MLYYHILCFPDQSCLFGLKLAFTVFDNPDGDVYNYLVFHVMTNESVLL